MLFGSSLLHVAQILKKKNYFLFFTFWTVSFIRSFTCLIRNIYSEKDVSVIEKQVYDEIVNRNKVVSVLDIEGEDRK